MSERDSNPAGQPTDDTEQFDLGDPSSPSSSSYPATSKLDTAPAPHADASEWQGNTGATDFLGLDADLRLDPAAGSASMEGLAGLSASSEGPVLDSWLMEIEGQTETATTTDFADPPADAEEADVAADEDAPRPSARPRLAAQLAAALALSTLCAAGTWYWKTHRAHVAPAPVEVATRPVPKPNPRGKIPAPKPATDPASATDPVPATAPVTAPDVTPSITIPDASSPADPQAVQPDATSPIVETPPALPAHVAVTPAPVELPPPTLTLPPPLVVPPTVPHTETPVALDPSRGTLRVLVDANGHPLPGSVRSPADPDFADLWRDQRVPTELFDADRRIRTLNVGRVRALVIGGEYFEGTLYAVGQGRIWLDLDLGRISFQASTVRELTQLPPLPAAVGKQKVDELAMLPRVEVRLPGGSITGRLIGQDGTRVTIVTDNGMRAVVESDDVRPVTERNTRVIGTVRELDKLPAAPPPH